MPPPTAPPVRRLNSQPETTDYNPMPMAPHSFTHYFRPLLAVLMVAGICLFPATPARGQEEETQPKETANPYQPPSTENYPSLTKPPPSVWVTALKNFLYGGAAGIVLFYAWELNQQSGRPFAELWDNTLRELRTNPDYLLHVLKAHAVIGGLSGGMWALIRWPDEDKEQDQRASRQTDDPSRHATTPKARCQSGWGALFKRKKP